MNMMLQYRRRRELRQAAALGIPPDPVAAFARSRPASVARPAAAPVAASNDDAHPLADAAADSQLADRERRVQSLFDALAGLARGEQPADAPEAARRLWAEASASGAAAPYAVAALHAFLNTVSEQAPLATAPAPSQLEAWGVHAIDVSPCSDGRLLGVVEQILRLPLERTRSNAFAGALFDVEASVRDWVALEHRRYREGQPNDATAPTRYLKVAVYHTSSSQPDGEGCAAHDSDADRAAEAAKHRLADFAQAIENRFCCGASVALLLIGVDTDTDTIRLHVPNADGRLCLNRVVDSHVLYHDTEHLSADEVRRAAREAVARAGGRDAASLDGLQQLCVQLIENNITHHAYMHSHYPGGRYPVIGHAERAITVGDSVSGASLRNLAYHANVHTVEEGSSDLDVGIGVMRRLNVEQGLPIPLLVNIHYQQGVPGSRERTACRARRLRAAVEARYSDLIADGMLRCAAAVEDPHAGGGIELLPEHPAGNNHEPGTDT